MRKNAADELVEQLKARQLDLQVKTIPYQGGRAHICYIAQLVDRKALSQFVVKPMVQYCEDGSRSLDAEKVNRMLYVDECILGGDLQEVEFNILNGQSVILFSSDSRFVIVNCKKVEQRNISTPELMYSSRGPRDAFVESLDTNLSLLRYRLKDGNIRIEKKEVGARTKSTVALVYLSDVANPALVKEVHKRIDAIRTDGIYESGELQQYLRDRKNAFFPQMGMVERSDMAVERLLEGKVIILVDGSCIALQAPVVFAELLQACDDRYENKYFGMFMRIIRYIAVMFSVSLTAFYVALAEFHTDTMPASYIVTFAQMRSRAPFSAFIAVLSVELIVELIREALLRVPVKIGSAIAIVGAIIIGQAATTSGVYTPLLLILTSISFLATFALPDSTLANPLRILKFLTIILTGFFGFFGFSLAITLILSMLVSVDSFGVPYMAPWAPFNGYDTLKTLIFSKRTSPKRQQYMRDKDDTRAPNGKKNKGK